MKKDISNKVLCGVCSGLANELKIDTVVVRLGFLLTAFLGFGLPILIYIALAIVMPE